MRPRRFSHSRHGHFYRRATRRRTGVRLCSHVSQTTDSQTFWIQLNLHEASVMQKRKPLRYAILANACVGKRSGEAHAAPTRLLPCGGAAFALRRLFVPL
jgi:hypothetical protein